ncbi:MAG: CBS domain-containing protein [Dethiobacter sp.]|nr:CBS domain-containing protein [Dethiobacter sp.]
MFAKDIMIHNLVLVDPNTPLQELTAKTLQSETAHALVVDDQKRLMGLVSGYDMRKSVANGLFNCCAADMMTPFSNMFVVSPDTPVATAARIMTEQRINQLPVVDGNFPIGYLNAGVVLKTETAEVLRVHDQLERYKQIPVFISAMREGLVAVDSEYVIQEFNPAAERLAGLSAKKMIGHRSLTYAAHDSLVRKVLESGKPLYNEDVLTNKGQTVLTNTLPIIHEGQVIGAVQTFVDVTETRRIHRELLNTRDELEKAFALTLPCAKVEQKLKNTPEYRDIFNPSTGMIEIIEVIEAGGYIHVVNALKVAADMNEKGLMSLPGIDKDTLTQALLFHDIGKSQPILNIGQVVDPMKKFEESTRHAARSAAIAKDFYNKSSDVVELIRFHHHQEEELPENFSQHLIPMLRLLKIIDGLSAGLTRRKACIGFRVNGSRLTVLEHSDHPAFNRTKEIDLYTGVEVAFLDK